MRPRSSMFVTVLGVFVLIAQAARAGTRHLAIIVDTSGSMQTNDRPRYTMQLSQVLSDLADTGDDLAVIRMPGDFLSSCSAGPSSSIVLRLDPSNRAAFKQGLDRFLTFDTGTYFGAPVRTAISLLPHDPAAQRMLLVIADSGGLGDCEAELTRELFDLKQSGVTIAAINLGGPSGAFDANPAFDFTTSALDAQGLIGAVALVYQRFLGAKHVQTGQVQGDISVEIAAYVDEAFLVVAADGPIDSLAEVAENPKAATVDLNHRGGGSTQGLDGVLRAYRIVRLERPTAGTWRFRASGVTNRAAWMLLQDSAVGVRMVSSTTVPKGIDVPLEVELIDQRTGARIADTSKLPGLLVTLDVDGRTVTFRDDGQGGDQQARDGILTATTSFSKPGDTPMTVHLQSDFLDRRVQMSAKVLDAAWRLDVHTPKRVEVDRPVQLSVILQPIGATSSLHPPERIQVLTGGPVIELRDNGQGSDRQAGDRIFTGSWTPGDIGTFRIDYVPVGGSATAQVSAQMEVLGHLRFGRQVPVQFGRLKSASQVTRQLDLGSADVRGTFPVQITSAFHRERSMLEIDTGNGWVPLGTTPQTLRLADGGFRTWPLRLTVGECPEGQPPNAPFELALTATGADGKPIRTTVTVTVEIVPDSWLHCWWPVIALVIGLVAAAIVVHGYWSPSRFPPKLGVVLSPEEDMSEGFFHPIRGVHGSRSGFYRDARIYICQDFRLASRSGSAVARLRADRKQVRIEPATGSSVWRQNIDGLWEPIPADESTARFGDVYRDEHGTLYFELRNA